VAAPHIFVADAVKPAKLIVIKMDFASECRHAAVCIWRRSLTSSQVVSRVTICQDVQTLGYDGCIDSSPANSIVDAWLKAGWIAQSPDGLYVRLTPEGSEQLATWIEEDRLWHSGGSDEIDLPRRLRAGQPATNFRRIHQTIGTRAIVGVHDPYLDVLAITNLLKLRDTGVSFSLDCRMLRPPIQAGVALRIASFIADVNIELGGQWELRTFLDQTKPHRRFLICDDGCIVTCGCSFNNINKDEVLSLVPAMLPEAKDDCRFFEDKWKLGTIVK
jgi:hypothetical protein